MHCAFYPLGVKAKETGAWKNDRWKGLAEGEGGGVTAGLKYGTVRMGPTANACFMQTQFHHLLIMESLGGDQDWSTRFFAQHSSILYYFALCFLWLLSPTLAYNFSELIEAHAVDSYDQFLEENAVALKQIPPPPIALSYYMADDLYKYDEFQSERPVGSRRVVIRNLYDVFEAVSGDEAEHVKTMAACQRKRKIEEAADAETAIATTAVAAFLADAFLKRLAILSAVGELGDVPEFVDGLAEFARAYVESGGVDAILNLITSLLPFLG